MNWKKSKNKYSTYCSLLGVLVGLGVGLLETSCVKYHQQTYTYVVDGVVRNVVEPIYNIKVSMLRTESEQEKLADAAYSDAQGMYSTTLVSPTKLRSVIISCHDIEYESSTGLSRYRDTSYVLSFTGNDVRVDSTTNTYYRTDTVVLKRTYTPPVPEL